MSFYTKAIKEFVLDKKTSPYMKSFQFTASKGATGFTDKNSVSNETQKNYAVNDSGNWSFIFSGKSTR